jgi:hypothetical protein
MSDDVMARSGAWKKSSRSTQGGCVEVRQELGLVQVRDSKNPGGPVLRFNHHEWTAFLEGVRLGEFDPADGS